MNPHTLAYYRRSMVIKMTGVELEMHRRILERALHSARVSLRLLAQHATGATQQEYQMELESLETLIDNVDETNRARL